MWQQSANASLHLTQTLSTQKNFQVFSLKYLNFFWSLHLSRLEMQDLSTLTSDIFFCLVFFCLPVFWAWTLCRGAVIRNTDVVTIKNDNSDPFTVTIVIWRIFFSQFFSKIKKNPPWLLFVEKPETVHAQRP